jgi:hypothetical protein
LTYRQVSNQIENYRPSIASTRPSLGNQDPIEPVRYLHHQNNIRVKAESEMINRFDRSHGTEVEMALPTSKPVKKPPLVTTLKAPATTSDALKTKRGSGIPIAPK